MQFKIIRAERAAASEVKAGDVCYSVDDPYGLAADDTEITGIDHVCVSLSEEGIPFFTIPSDDIEPLLS